MADGRRPVRFFNHEIAQDGTIWLEPNMTVLSARYSHDGTQWPGRWHVVVVEYGDALIDGDDRG